MNAIHERAIQKEKKKAINCDKTHLQNTIFTLFNHSFIICAYFYWGGFIRDFSIFSPAESCYCETEHFPTGINKKRSFKNITVAHLKH